MAENHYTKRFWDKVDKRGPDECWEWTASKFRQGYGAFWLEGKMRYAHRIAWELTKGHIPRGDGYHGTCVLHKCDNRACVNVMAHLFIGSNADNMADMATKGRARYAHGEKHPCAKLTKADVIAIRSISGTKVSIAATFGISPAHVGRIKSTMYWKHLD